jgi:two-component system alkaline phosphatase synthesis response regulator PhoP
MSQARILLVDDEPAIVETVRAYLEAEGYAVQTASDGPGALTLARSFHPDVIVLDLMLPGLDGLEVLRRVRQVSDVYILLLTAKTHETDKVIGLTMGALLRRGRSSDAGDAALVFRRLRLDPQARRIWKDAAPVELTPLEFDLLYALARYRGRVLSREQLIEQVWGYDYYGEDRVVDVHLGRIRKKIEDNVATPRLIVTVRGAGYRFEDEPV